MKVMTPDIVLSFVLWLRKTRQSLARRLLFRMKDLQQISIWDTGESGGFFHHYDNQHERSTYTACEYPASRHNSTQYFSESGLPLHRPQAYNFTNNSKQYPLLGTAQIITCPRCGGSGQVTCSGCGGSGRVAGTNSEGRSTSVTCSSCGGSGNQRCSRCSGEGRLLTYTSKDYIWKHTVDNEPILSSVTNRRSVRGLITKTHKKGGSYKIEEFRREEIIEATGVYNGRIEALVEYARNEAVKKEQQIADRFGTVLFQRRERFYIPLGFINLFVAKRYGQYFVAGNLASRLSHSPPVTWSRLKLLGWFAVGISISMLVAIFRGYLVLAQRDLRLLTIGLGLVLFFALLRFFRDFFVQYPKTWLIFDDDGLGGWLFVHLMVQAISLTRKGKLLDPCYTDLFHLPEPNTRKSRNSFFCTIETLKMDNPDEQSGSRQKAQQRQTTELFLVSQRALAMFTSEIQEVAQNIQTFIWVMSQSPVVETDNCIANLLKAQSPETRKNLRLILITNQTNLGLSVNEFPQTQAYLSGEQITLHSLPLSEAFQCLQQGKLSPETEKTLNFLVEMVQPSTVLQPNSPPTDQLSHQEEQS